MVRAICGTMHHRRQVFQPYNGMQCTAIALAALLFLASDAQWRSSSVVFSRDVDSILFDGTALYGNVVRAGTANPGQYLSHSQLPTSVESGYNIHYFLDQYYGIVQNGNHGHDEGFIMTSLRNSILEGSRLSRYMLLTLSELTVAVHINHTSGTYMFFYSHQRDDLGCVEPNHGTAVALLFESITDIISYFVALYSGYAFELTAVHIAHDTDAGIVSASCVSLCHTYVPNNEIWNTASNSTSVHHCDLRHSRASEESEIVTPILHDLQANDSGMNNRDTIKDPNFDDFVACKLPLNDKNAYRNKTTCSSELKRSPSKKKVWLILVTKHARKGRLNLMLYLN
jgi:hypothetical protein